MCRDRFSHLTIYAGSSLTEATVFESADDVDDCDDNIPGWEAIPADNEASIAKCAWGTEPLFYGSPEISFGIRTDSDELICIITVSRIYAHAGDDLQVWLSFDQSTQGSHCVRATLLQREIRSSDGALLKVLRPLGNI